MAPRVWLITGASTGIGRTLTEHVLSSGDIAIATLRQPDALADLSTKYTSTQLLITRLDVTQLDEVKAAFALGLKTFGRIDVVVSNAGAMEFREVESNDDNDETARKIFEVNFWGSLRVMREAVATFRDGKHGGILLPISSFAGTIAFPAVGMYTASKHALQGITGSLQKELLPEWNIYVGLVELGGFQTPIHKKDTVAPVPDHYNVPHAPSNQVRQYRVTPAFVDGMLPADLAAKALVDIVKKQSEGSIKLPPRIVLGGDAVDYIEGELKAHLADVETAKQNGWDLRKTEA